MEGEKERESDGGVGGVGGGDRGETWQEEKGKTERTTKIQCCLHTYIHTGKKKHGQQAMFQISHSYPYTFHAYEKEQITTHNL